MNRDHRAARRNGTRRAALFLGAVLLAMSCSAQAAPPDLSGVWKIEPQPSIRTTRGEIPPLLPQARQIYEQRARARKTGDTSFDPAARCKPLGEPRILFEPGSFEILQRPELITFLFQWNRMVRFVAMSQAQSEPLGPTYFGQSVGKWEGDSLVIDVIGIHATTLLDAAGLPHSEALHLTERFRLEGRQSLEAKITIEDPKTYSRPWEIATEFRKQPARTRIPEDVCVERLKIAP
jgi:hypothetical protein